MSEPSIYLFGEVLFDIFPNKTKVLGGAPFNVTWHLNALGQNPQLVSRIGADDDGKTISELMKKHGFTMSGLQVDQEYPTGIVDVSINDDEPCYEIVKPSAYDFIVPMELQNKKALLYHGSLALRNDVSASTLQTICKQFEGDIFFDVNLRTPWWEKEKIVALLDNATWLKLNEEELDVLFPSAEKLITRLENIIKQFNLKGILFTQGQKGAMVCTNQGMHYSVQPKRAAKLVDTVGAGDGFTSVFIFGLLQGWPLDITLERAQDFALMVVEQTGAIIMDKHKYETLLSEWQAVS